MVATHRIVTVVSTRSHVAISCSVRDSRHVSLLRWLGLAGTPNASATETDTVRRIAARLDALAPDEARRVAAFAYVLARIANADLRTSADEIDEMERIVASEAGLDTATARLVVEIARGQARLFGGTEDYVVTRELRRVTSREERVQMLRCACAVAAADGGISSLESSTLVAIGEELGFAREEVMAVRSEWRDRLTVLRNEPGER